MELRLSLEWTIPYVVVPKDPAGLGLCLLLTLFVGLAAFQAYRHRARGGPGPWLVGLAAASGGSILAGSVWLELTHPALQWVLGPRVPLLAFVPILLAAWFGDVLPAGLTAAAVGLVTSGQADHSLVSFLAATLAGLAIGHLLRQQLAGQAFAILRRPSAAVLAGSLLWPVPFWRSLVAPVFLVPAGEDIGPAYFLGILGPALIAGGLGEALFLVRPASRPAGHPARVLPYQKSLTSRLMATFVPMLLLVALAGTYGANMVAARAAARQVEAGLSPMAFAVRNELEWTRRAAESALSQMAAQVSPSPERLGASATLDTRGLFSAVWALDPTGEVVATRSEPSASPPTPTLPQVLQLARDPNRWVWTASGELLVQAPLLDSTGEVQGYLVAAIPAKERVAAVLQDLEQPVQGGTYFLWPATLPGESVWLFGPIAEEGDPLAPSLEGSFGQSQPERKRSRFLTPSGHLGFAVPVEACDAAFGILLSPNAFAASALPVSWPILAILAVAAVGTAAASSSLTASALRPLKRLVQAAGRIARGHWSTPIQVASPDEVGRLALAVEEMRRTLQARGQQIALLADLAEGSLEHEAPQGHLVRLLRGLLRSSEANASAVVVWAGQPELSSIVREQKAGATVPSDAWIRGLAGDLAVQRGAIFHERLLAAPLAQRFAEPLAMGVHALAALPLALNGTYLGMLYVQYPTPQNFSQMERGLLLALARQATLLLSHADARARWRQAEQQLHTLLEASYDPVLVLSAEGHLLAANRAAERAFHFDFAQWRGKPISPDLAGQDLARLVTRTWNAQAPFSAEATIRPQRTFAFRAAPFGGAPARPTGWVLVGRDMSDLKALDAMKRDFVTAFSHDLKTPLQRVRSLLTVIPMFSELTAKQKELLQSCVEQLDGVSNLVGGIMELAQVEGASSLHLGPCQLAVLLSQAAEEHRPAARAKRIRVHLEIGAQPPVILADEPLVRLALHHLLENAIRFTPSGGRVILGLTSGGEQVVLHVQDTGAGIPPDEQPRVFERFYRGREAVAAGIPGNGLGLAVVRAVAEAHGGRAWLESTPGEGSTFYLALPRASAGTHRGEPLAEQKAQAHR